MMISSRHRLLLRQLWHAGPASRWELHQQTHIRPNTIGADASALIKAGLLREGEQSVRTRGRPRIPLQIDGERRHAIGLAIQSGRVEAQRVNLLGEPIGKPTSRSYTDISRTSATASLAVKDLLDDDTLAVGITVRGSFDRQQSQLIFDHGNKHSETSLGALLNAVAPRAAVVSTPLQAMAAHWLLEEKAGHNRDLMLIDLLDGQIEAAVLGGSRPTLSRLVSNNPLGAMRLTPLHSSRSKKPLEAIDMQTVFSTPHLATLGRRKGQLHERLAAMDAKDQALHQVLDAISNGISNAVNFAQPEHVVFTGLAGEHPQAFDAIAARLQKHALPSVQRTLSYTAWAPPSITPAHLAGWLVLAEIYIGGWSGMPAQA